MKKKLLAIIAGGAAMALLAGCVAREQRISPIGEERAGEIAMAAAGLEGGEKPERLSVESGSVDGLDHYDVVFYYNGAEYSCQIDALSGRVIQWGWVGDPREAPSTAPQAAAGQPQEAATPAPQSATPVPETVTPAATATSPPNPKGGITPEEAKALALSLVPGAGEEHIREFETDYDDGRLEYEGTIIYEGMEYEFEIDGYSGYIRNWEAERED